MDACQCIMFSQHGSTLSSCRTANPLVRLVEGEESWKALDHLKEFSLKIVGSCCRLVVKVTDSQSACQEFEPSTAKSPPCMAAVHVKSIESSNVLPSVWCVS
ncbi:hypothetical protein TNCV_2340051 [Trichonephila clavipes]|nr:hypothetical protein TNCV_2340051 [Trichonephila clavipes]